MNKRLITAGAIVVAAGFPASAAATNTPPQHIPVTICHNGNTITVDDDAVPAHTAHGDTVGACVVTPPVEPPVEPPVVPEVPVPPVAPPSEPQPPTPPTPETPQPPAPPVDDKPLVEEQPDDKPGKLTADRPVKKPKDRVEIGTPASFSSPDPSAGVPLATEGESLPVTGLPAWLLGLCGAIGCLAGIALYRATRQGGQDG